jgi:hypothetical protein
MSSPAIEARSRPDADLASERLDALHDRGADDDGGTVTAVDSPVGSTG